MASVAGDAADWSADSEADQSTSSSDASLVSDDEDSPVPAEKGKKVVTSRKQAQCCTCVLVVIT